METTWINVLMGLEAIPVFVVICSLCLLTFSWIFLPWLLLSKLNKILQSIDKLNDGLDCMAKGMERYINKK